MQYPYSLDCLTPLSVRMEESDTHAVYNLPAPKKWSLLHWSPDGEEYTKKEELVSKVRVCLSGSADHQPQAIVVPYGPDGKEWPSSSAILRGVISYVGVLARMGFVPILPLH